MLLVTDLSSAHEELLRLLAICGHMFCRQLGKPDTARVLLNDLVASDPDCGIAWHTLGEIATELGEADEAINCFSLGKQSSGASLFTNSFKSMEVLFMVGFLHQITIIL